MTVIEIQSLRKIYKGNVGVKDISLKVNKGEIFGFLGLNGAGKTTAIKLMLDIIRPDAGEIKIFGKSIRKYSIEIRKNIGYLPGDFQAFEGLTGKEFLSISNSLKQTNYNIDNLLDRLELASSDLDRKVKTYSQGMKQKLGIINAMSSNPELLILDEPSSGLDPIIQYKLYDLLRELSDSGTTIFFSSHNLPEVERICDRVAVIREGRLVVISSLVDLRKNSSRKIFLRLKNKLDNLEVKGTKVLSYKNGIYELLVLDEINDVISSINQLDIENITIPEPTLENIFKSYYQK